MRGRAVTFATCVTLFAALPFLQGSSPQLPRQSVELAAGSSVASPASTGYPAAAPLSQATPPASSAGLDAVSDAIGGGLFVFPALAMTPIVAATATTTPNAQGISFIRPVPGPEVSPFGPRIHPLLGVPMFHTGIDLMATCGTPIRAAASGTVIYAEVSASWGLRTIIQHSPSLKTAYGHQSKFFVKEGDHVNQGDVIGLVGTTGWSTGCHLHFDVILNDQYVDPAPYLGLPPSDARSIPFHQTPGTVSTSPGTSVAIDDGDVPIPADTGTSSLTSSTTTTPTKTTTSSPSSSTTSSPSSSTTSSTTSSPTSDPSTTTSPTSDPTTTTTTSPTSDPTTSSATTTTTSPTSDPTTSSATTSDPAPSTSSSTSSAGSTSAAEPTASTTSAPATTTAGTSTSGASTSSAADTSTSTGSTTTGSTTTTNG